MRVGEAGCGRHRDSQSRQAGQFGETMSFTSSEAHRYIGGIFDAAFADPEIGPKLTATGIVLRFEFTDPECTLVVDMPGRAVHAGEPAGIEPSATMAMKCETANA